jgi:SSS family solute:Na+ symporter
MYASLTTLLTIFAFSFTPLILAEVARKRSLPTIEDFFILGRSMSTPMLFFTIYATWVSSYAFIGSASIFYTRGAVYATCFAWNALFSVLLFFVCERIWYYGKTNGYTSPVDFFSDIYGSRPLALLVSVIMVVFTLPYLQIQLSVGAQLIEMVTGGQIPWRVSGLLFYLVIIIYLWSGGLRAVALTDIFYGVLIFGSMLFTGFYMVHIAGGTERVFGFLSEHSPGLLSLTGAEGNVLLWLSMFLIVPLGALMGPSIWIRSYAARERKAFRLLPALICLSTIEYIGPILSGAAGYVLMPDIQNTDTLIPNLLIRYAPTALSGLLFCGIAAAALSTANSQIHASAAIYTLNIHRTYINPNASDARLLVVAKRTVLVISAVAYLFMLRTPEFIIDTGSVALAGTAQIIVPTVGALFWERSNARAAFLGLACGVAFAGLAFFIDINGHILGVVGLFVNALVFVVLSRTLRPSPLIRSKIMRYRAAYRSSLS